MKISRTVFFGTDGLFRWTHVSHLVISFCLFLFQDWPVKVKLPPDFCHSELNLQIVMHILSLNICVFLNESQGMRSGIFMQFIIWHALMVEQYIVIKTFCGSWCRQTFWLDKSFSIQINYFFFLRWNTL